MSTASVDEEVLAKVLAPPDRMERCSRCAHSQQAHLDDRDGTIRECNGERPATVEAHSHYRAAACKCSGFLLLFARQWPEDSFYQVKTEVTANWSVTYSRKMLAPIDDRPSMSSLLIAVAVGVAIPVSGLLCWWFL